jgi:hypothetical protein
MTREGNRLQHDGIQIISGFVMAYKGVAKFAMTHMELSLHKNDILMGIVHCSLEIMFRCFLHTIMFFHKQLNRF